MEEAWYLFPGQKLETTKIKDRGKALIATKSAWKSITDHLHEKQYQQEIVEEEEARKNYLKEGCKEMTKNWTNSFEKIQERRMRDLTMKAQLKEENLVKRFLELRAEQQAERDIILSQLSRKLYMTTEKPRQLNTALIQSETLFERNLQVEFNKKLREHEKIEEMNEARAIKYNAEQEVIENAAKKKWRKDTDVKHSQELMDQIKEIQETEKKNKEERIKNEIIDITRSKEEYDEIVKWEKEEARRIKADVKKQFNDFLVVQKEIKDENDRQDKIQDKIIKICERGKCRIDLMKVETSKKQMEEKLEIRRKIAEKLMVAKEGNEAEEDERIANQVKEHEDRENELNRKRELYQKKLKKDMEENLRLAKLQKAKDDDDRNEIKKWEFLNRLKTKEVMEKYNLDKLQKLFDSKIKYRHILDKQKNAIDTKKNNDRKQCFDAEMKAIRDKIDFEDGQFFEYAQEVYDLAKSRGRDTYPIQRVINKYRKETNLMFKPGLAPKKDARNIISSIRIGVPEKPNERQKEEIVDNCDCVNPQAK